MDDINNNGMPDMHEAKMARADLYKLANYSMKLFKMIQEGQELEGWVQAKITKAADYIASVYHFMEYEMKASEFGSHLENAEVYSESVRRAFVQRLIEAKKQKAEIAAKAKKELDETSKRDLEKYKNSKDSIESSKYAKNMTPAQIKKSAHRDSTADVYGGEYSSRVKVPKKNLKANLPEEVDEGIEDRLADARAKAAAKGKTTKKETPDTQSNVRKVAGKAYGGSKQKDDEKVDEEVNKSDVPAYKRKSSGDKDWKVSKADLDKEANNPKNISSKAGLAKRKQELGMSEATGDYSAKKGAAGKDLGKPGKNFDKIAKSAGEKYGSKESGEKVAGAVLKKLRTKEGLETLKKKLSESTLVEFAMDAMKHPKYGKIEWINYGGAHMIVSKDPSGAMKIHTMGTQPEIAAKWNKLKSAVAGRVESVVESILSTVI